MKHRVIIELIVIVFIFKCSARISTELDQLERVIENICNYYNKRKKVLNETDNRIKIQFEMIWP